MLVLPESITNSTAVACLAGLGPALEVDSAAAVLVDAAGLSQFDSAALAVLLELRRKALRLNKTLLLKNLPTRLQDLARLYGITELLPTPT
jgi:phospholipid transport system transporter-binding protein